MDHLIRGLFPDAFSSHEMTATLNKMIEAVCQRPGGETGEQHDAVKQIEWQYTKFCALHLIQNLAPWVQNISGEQLEQLTKKLSIPLLKYWNRSQTPQTLSQKSNEYLNNAVLEAVAGIWPDDYLTINGNTDSIENLLKEIKRDFLTDTVFRVDSPAIKALQKTYTPLLSSQNDNLLEIIDDHLKNFNLDNFVKDDIAGVQVNSEFTAMMWNLMVDLKKAVMSEPLPPLLKGAYLKFFQAIDEVAAEEIKNKPELAAAIEVKRMHSKIAIMRGMFLRMTSPVISQAGNNDSQPLHFSIAIGLQSAVNASQKEGKLSKPVNDLVRAMGEEFNVQIMEWIEEIERPSISPWSGTSRKSPSTDIAKHVKAVEFNAVTFGFLGELQALTDHATSAELLDLAKTPEKIRVVKNLKNANALVSVINTISKPEYKSAIEITRDYVEQMKDATAQQILGAAPWIDLFGLANSLTRKLLLAGPELVKACKNNNGTMLAGITGEIKAWMEKDLNLLKLNSEMLSDSVYLHQLPPQIRKIMVNLGENFHAIFEELNKPDGAYRSLMKLVDAAEASPQEVMDTVNAAITGK